MRSCHSYLNVFTRLLQQLATALTHRPGSRLRTTVASGYRGSLSQSRFFDRDVKSRFLEKSIEVFVVISDGLHVVCQELNDMLNKQIWLCSTLKYQVTQPAFLHPAGMASLLPFKELGFGEGDTILADGKSTQDFKTGSRSCSNTRCPGTSAIPAETLMK